MPSARRTDKKGTYEVCNSGNVYPYDNAALLPASTQLLQGDAAGAQPAWARCRSPARPRRPAVADGQRTKQELGDAPTSSKARGLS